MAEQRVTYPVILHAEAAGGYSVEVPDINGGSWTQGETVTEALTMAQDLIGTMLVDATELPVATPFERLSVAPDDAKAVVSFDLNDFRQRNAKTTRVNVSIPEYLRDAARKQGVNFSRLLTTALHQKLDI